MPVFIQRDGQKQGVASLAPFLNDSLQKGCRMDKAQMAAADQQICRWLGFGIGKGVTDPERNISVFGLPEIMTAGLHGLLIQGFPGVGTSPECYEQNDVLGFGGFVRWVYFANPGGGNGILGIDFSLCAWSGAGVANTMFSVSRLAKTCLEHGISPQDQLVLLNCRMIEEPCVFSWRQSLGLCCASNGQTKKKSSLQIQKARTVHGADKKHLVSQTFIFVIAADVTRG